MGKSIFEFTDKFNYDSPWDENWLPPKVGRGVKISQIDDISFNSQRKEKSLYRVLLFGGVDYFNDGSYGTNKKLAEYVEIIATSELFNIPMQKGDIRIVNSPLFSNEPGGKDIYNDIVKIIRNNFDLNNGILILYGYSWGGQMLMEFLEYFKKDNIGIDLLITVDAAKGPVSFSVNNDVTSNVNQNLNIYQTTPSPILSRGSANDGTNVKNVDLTGEKNSSGEEIAHSNIDEYTLAYCAEVIGYALANQYFFKNKSQSQIKKDIKEYADKGL